MRLLGADGRSLELSILGYQYPDLAGSRVLSGSPRLRGAASGFDYDANWLLILGQASDGERAWTFRDPCLLTTEAGGLMSWLHAVADGRPAVDIVDFTEPNLEFRLVSPPGAQPVVRVIFRLESRPPWAPNITEEDWDIDWLDFDMSSDDLRAAANDVGTELARYPER